MVKVSHPLLSLTFGPRFLIGALLLLFVSCANKQASEQKAYRELLTQGRFEEAMKHLEASELAKNKDSSLLLLMEKGRVLQLQGKNLESIPLYDQALDLAKQLYTERISKKILKALFNDQQDIYYGLPYEISQLHILQIVNYLQCSQQADSDKERVQYLQKAKSLVVALDSFLKTLKKELLGEDIFKDDLSAKIIGAYVHLQIDTAQDRQTALLLYREAWDLLFKNYNLYKTYNFKATEFRQNFDKLPTLEIAEIENSVVSRTNQQHDLRQFLLEKIVRLTRKQRPAEIKQLARKLGVGEDVVKGVSDDQRPNVVLFIQSGLIPEKQSKRYDIGLEGAMNETDNNGAKSLIAQVGMPLLAHFAADVLGLYPQNPSLPGMIGSVYGSRAVVSIATIGFELPKMIAPYREDQYQVRGNFQGQGEKVFPIPNILPLGDMAEEAVEENSVGLYTRTGLRVAGKHIGAIVAAYSAFKAAGETITAKWAAVAAYALATRGIAETEKADVRYWSSLPWDYRWQELALSEGDNELKLKLGQGGEVTLPVKVEKNKSQFVVKAFLN